jgi:hypothetical protein
VDLREDLAAVDPWHSSPRETEGNCKDVDHDSCTVPTSSDACMLGSSRDWVIFYDTTDEVHSKSLTLSEHILPKTPRRSESLTARALPTISSLVRPNLSTIQYIVIVMAIRRTMPYTPVEMRPVLEPVRPILLKMRGE